MRLRTRCLLYFGISGLYYCMLFWYIGGGIPQLSITAMLLVCVSVIMATAVPGWILAHSLRKNLRKIHRELSVYKPPEMNIDGKKEDEFTAFSNWLRQIVEQSKDDQDRYQELLKTYMDLEEKYAQSYTVRLILEEISRELDPSSLLQKATDIVMGVFGCKGCIMYMVDEKCGKLVVRAHSGFADLKGQMEIPLAAHNLIARCWRNRKIYNEIDVKPLEAADLRMKGIRYIQTIPLTGRGECLGVMVTIPERRLSKDLLEFATLIAQELSMSVENADLYSKMRQMAIHDPLTGVYNRMYLINYIVELFSKNPVTVSVVLIDMDFFKRINDRYGHLMGDLVLKTTTALIQKIIPKGILARYGGEEFVVVLPETGQEEAVALAEKMRETIANHSFITTEGEKIPVSLSAGLATYPVVSDNYEELLKLADEALYQAKNHGRNRVCVAVKKGEGSL